jgi:hypothetical protein
MTFIKTVPHDGAPPAVAQMYDADRTPAGDVPNYTRAFSHRPDVYTAWQQLGAALKANMDLRRYAELEPGIRGALEVGRPIEPG